MWRIREAQPAPARAESSVLRDPSLFGGTGATRRVSLSLEIGDRGEPGLPLLPKPELRRLWRSWEFPETDGNFTQVHHCQKNQTRFLEASTFQ
jgi:hypothetical protein